MEVVESVRRGLPLIISAFEKYQSFTNGIECQTTARPVIPNICHLRVYDLDFGSGAHQQLAGQSNSRVSLRDDLESLPPQDARFRVYVADKFTLDDGTLLDNLSSRGFSVASRLSDGAEHTFEALASQWKKSNGTSYESTMYTSEFAGQKHGVRDPQINQGLEFLAGLITLKMRVRISDVAKTDDKSIGI